MNIFLIASNHGRKQYEAHYQRLVDLVKSSGNTLKSDYVFSDDLPDIENKTIDESAQWLKKILIGLKKSDAVFVELSYRSSTAGYLLAQAVNWGKPVVVFYTGNEEPHLLSSLEAINDKLVVVRYSRIEDLDREVPLMIDFVADSQDTRFNFFVSPSISYYLDWVSKTKRVPRSVYLRRLIDDDMEENETYWESQS